MKWMMSKKSGSSLSSTAASMIGSVFPVSWISKFKKKVDDLETGSVKGKQRGPTPSSSCWREGRFYRRDEDDPYWRLSFTSERIEPPGYDRRVSNSGFASFSARDLENSGRKEERWNFNFDDLVLDIKKKRKGKKPKNAVTVECAELRSGGDEFEKWPKEEVKMALKSEGNDVFEEFFESNIQNSRKPGRCLSSIKEDDAIHGRKNNPKSGSPNMEDKSFTETTKKREYRKGKNFSSRKPNQSYGVKVYSPRTECKIRALQDMKKSKTLPKKKPTKEKGVEGGSMFDCYAVVKSSFNPQQDFRDSMVEMMVENDIRQPHELEDLLTCYLTFNRDEYHDIIIKVFRQAWFELNKGVLCS